MGDKAQAQAQVQDPLQGLGGPMTRARTRKAQEALKHVVSSLLEAQPHVEGLNARETHGLENKAITCIMHLD